MQTPEKKATSRLALAAELKTMQVGLMKVSGLI
jgi:hypothetical protein